MSKYNDSGVMLDSDYWDCECEHYYIHPKSINECRICGAVAEDQPDSHADEVGVPQNMATKNWK